MYNDFVKDEYVHCDEKCEECEHYIEFKEGVENGRS